MEINSPGAQGLRAEEKSSTEVSNRMNQKKKRKKKRKKLSVDQERIAEAMADVWFPAKVENMTETRNLSCLEEQMVLRTLSIISSEGETNDEGMIHETFISEFLCDLESTIRRPKL
jgi:hypothetical protein